MNIRPLNQCIQNSMRDQNYTCMATVQSYNYVCPVTLALMDSAFNQYNLESLGKTGGGKMDLLYDLRGSRRVIRMFPATGKVYSGHLPLQFLYPLPDIGQCIKPGVISQRFCICIFQLPAFLFYFFGAHLRNITNIQFFRHGNIFKTNPGIFIQMICPGVELSINHKV